MYRIAVMHDVERISDKEESVFVQMGVKVFASFASFLGITLLSASSAHRFTKLHFLWLWTMRKRRSSLASEERYR